MIRMVILSLAVLFFMNSQAQIQPTDPDKSPLDVSYSPQSYPVLKFQTKNIPAPNARVLYSRPQVKGRDIFGGEIKFNEIWRVGANEATELELFKNATIAGKKVAKGRYTLFCIPTAENWTLIINKDTDSWGSFSYNPALDVTRVTVPVQKTDSNVEYFTMYFDVDNNLKIMWADTQASIPFQFTNVASISAKSNTKK